MSASENSPLLLPDTFYGITEADAKRASEDAALGMVSPDAPILQLAAEAVLPEYISFPYIQKVVAELFATANGQRGTTKGNKKGRTLVGLAAPQIGESLRIIIIDTGISRDRKRKGKLECFINPEIIWRSRETDEGREGCFSAGAVWGLVRRPVAVKIRAIDQNGRPVERVFEDFTARIAQHEIDHLNGIRFPDRIKVDKKRHWVHAEELAMYPKHVKHWNRLCSKERWEQVKAGIIQP